MVQAYQHLWLAQRDDVYQRFASANHAIQPWRPNRLDAGSNNLASRSGRRPLGRGLVVPGASHGPIAQAARPSRVLEVELQVGSRPSAPTATYLTSCRTSPALRASVSPDSLRVHCAPLQSNWTPLTLCKEPSSSPRCRLRIDCPRLPNHLSLWLGRYRVRGQDSAVCDRASVLV